VGLSYNGNFVLTICGSLASVFAFLLGVRISFGCSHFFWVFAFLLGVRIFFKCLRVLFLLFRFLCWSYVSVLK